MRLTCLLFARVSKSGDSQVVFRSDVSLVRVDAQVVDRVNRAINDLRVDDFVLNEGGRLQPIRYFPSEDMPVDVLLLDVSASISHLQRIADVSSQALTVLSTSDRIPIMFFDHSTGVRLPFSWGRQELQRELIILPELILACASSDRISRIV